MSKLAEFREKNPAYKDVPDEKLAPALHRKFYSHIPQDEFYQQIGFGEKQAPGLIERGIAAIGNLRRRMQAEVNASMAAEGDGLISSDEQNRAILAYQKREREAELRREMAPRQSEVPADGYFPDNQSRAPSAVDRLVAERRIRDRKIAAGRTIGEVISDAAGAVGAGIQQIPASFVGLFAPDSETAKRMQRAAQAAEGNLSPYLQARLEEARERIQAAAQDGLWDEVKVAADEYLTDPTLFSYFALRTLPSMLGVLGPAKLAQAAAAMRGASAAQIARVTAATAGAANAGMTGGDARQQAYDTLYRALREQGVPDEEARARALEESLLPAGVGAGLGWLGGKYGAEAGMLRLGAGRTAAGRAAGVIARETTTEQAEELAPQLLTNSLASRIDGRNPLEGLGETAAQTVAGIGPMATVGAVGAARQPATEADAAARDLQNLVEGARFVQPADQVARQLLDPENAQLTEVPDAAASLDATGDQGQGADPRGGAGLARDGGEGAAGGSGAAGETASGGGAGVSLGDPAGQSTAGVVDPLDQLILQREQEALATGDPIEVLVAQAENTALRAAATPRPTPAPAWGMQQPGAATIPTVVQPDGTLRVSAPVEAVQNLTQALGVPGLAGKLLRTRNNETVVSAKTADQVNAALQYALEPFRYSAQDQADVELLARAQGARPGAIQLVTPDALPATVQGASDARLSAADAIFLGRVLGANARSLVLFRADPKEVGLGGAIIRGRTGKVFLNVAGAINPVAEAVHEVGHSIRRENEGAYQAYLSALASTQALDMSDDALVTWAQRNFGAGIASVEDAIKAIGVSDRDALLEEFVMDATGYASTRAGFWDAVFDELSKTNPSALQALIQGMKALAARLRQELFQRGARFAGIEKHIRDLEKLTELAGRYYAQGAKAAGQKVSDAYAEAGTVVASKQRIGPFAKAESARATQEWYARRGVQYEIEQTPEGVFLARVGDTNGQASSAQGAGTDTQPRGRSAGVRRAAVEDLAEHQHLDGRSGRAAAVSGSAGERGGYSRGVELPRYGRPTQEGAVTVVGTHFSHQQRQHLAGALFGTGHAAEEAARLEGADPEIRSRVYFYVDEGNGVTAEIGTGRHAHEVELSNLYDLSTDALGLYARRSGTTDGERSNNFEKALVDAGYDGYYKAAALGAAGKTQGVAVLLGKRHLGVPVAYLGQGDGKIPARPGAKPVKTDTVSPVTQAKELAARARALKGMPAGELPASRWRDMLAGADEEVFQAFDKAGLLDGEERVYLSELAGRYVRQAAAGEVVRSPTRTLEKENQVSITVGGKPGEFGWSPAAKLAAAQQEPAMDPAKLEGKEVPPFVGPTQQRPSLEAIGEAVRKVLAAKPARDTIEALTGARITGVAQIAGSWEGKPEPSFVLTGEMSFEQANEASKVLGFLMAQDATVAAQPWFEEVDDQIPAILISQNKVMTAEQVKALADAARAAGLDYSTTVDGRGAKFLHFGDQDGYLALRAAVDEIRKAAGLKELTDFYVRSNLNEAETYLEGGVGSLLRQARDQAGTGGPSDLFRRAVDSILVPYAKAVGAEGYRFSPERYGRRFGLTDAEVEYIRAALRPKSGKALSTVPKPRYVWGEKGSYLKDQAAGDRPAILRSPRRLLTAAWSKLAESPDVFQYPKSDADTMQGVFKDLGVGFTVSERFILSDKETRRGVVKKWVIKTADGREAEVFRNKKDEIWVNASALKVGVSRGAALYAGLLNYAYNSMGKLIGDPLGVSDMAIFRRTENMLSSALKFGTTEHMAPAKEQQNPALFAGTMGHTSGVTEQFKPLAWSDDHQENLANLLEVSYAHVTRFVPEVKDAYYDFNTGEFRWSATDQPLTRGDFERLARALRRGLGDPTVGVGGAEPAGSDSVPALRPGAVRGGATLQRAILTHTLLRAARSEDGGRSSLAAIGGELRGGLGREGQAPAGSGTGLSGILYSKTRLSVSGSGRGAVHATSEDFARAGSVPGAVFATDAGPRVTEHLAIGVDRVTTAEEAAHVLAAMRRNAEEKFQVLVLDAEQKPIAVLNLFAGATSQTSVFPGVVAKAVYETPGAATVWYAHNHPSGSPVPSDADLRITRALSTSFGPGTGIEVGGHVILAGTRYGALEGETGDPLPGGAIKPRARNKSVPVTVRRIKKAGTLADAITSPDEALQEIERIAQGKTGIVFANAANAPVAFLPMSAEQMQTLRDGSSARTLFGAAAKANASAAFLYFDRSVGSAEADRAQRNLAHALNARDVRMLDAFFYNRDGDLTSMAARGILESSDGDGIFRSAARIQTAAFPAPALPDSRSKRVLDKVIYNLQDRLVDLKEIQKSIEAAGRTIRDEFNPYMAETLMHGKAAYRVQHFLEQEIEPVLALMRGAGISVEELNRYLHARHAAERNAAMAKRNPNQDELDQLIQDAGEELLDAELAASADPTDGAAQRRVIRAQTRLDALRAAKPWSGTEEERQRLSGMSNDEAKAILDAAHGGPKAAVYRKLGQKIDAITGQTRSEMAAYGLESLETVGAMDQAYDHYVPLHRDMDESDLLDTMGGTGQGFSIRGSQVKRATGSLRTVENILANVVAQREATIVRGEKNRVAKALYGLVMEHPNPDLFTVIRPGMPEKQLRAELQSMGLDPATVDTMVKAPMVSVINERTGLAERRVNPMYSRLDNAVVLRINGEDRVILFNKENDRAVRLVRALRNDDAESGGSRFIMDHIGPITRYLAAINTQYNPIFGLTNFTRDLQSAALNLETTPIADRKAQLVGNIPAAIRGIWNWERGDRQHPWAKLYEEFLADGGATGYRDAYGSLAGRAAAIERDLGKTGLRNAAGIRQVLDLLSDYNTAVENATRLAAYKVARDAGISRAKAADLAKDITVNFNRKGARSGFWASLYAFFNSAVQGTERTIRVLRGPTGKKILGAGVALGAMNAALGMLLLGDDWDEIPEFERAKHLILPLPWTEQKYVKIPYPLGYNAIPNVGRSVVEMAVYRDRLGERGLALLGETLDAFNPISASTMVGMVMPSVLDPAVELASNQNAFGRPISKEDLSPLDPTPGFTRAQEGTAGPFKALAQGINAATGGDDYAPGLWSPTAEQLSYVFGVATGGLGREIEKFIATGEATIKGDPLPPYKIPVVGRFYGEAGGDNVIRKQYFDAIREVNIAENQLKGRARDGKDIDGFELGALAQASRRFQSSISALQKEAQRTQDREERKRINQEIVELQRQFVELVAQSRP